MKYDVGDVVLVHFPFTNKKGKLELKIRPAIVLQVQSDNEWCLIQCTSKNRSSKLPGIWVECRSEEGIHMGILRDSFINLKENRTLHTRLIIRKIGRCPFMEKIEELMHFFRVPVKG